MAPRGGVLPLVCLALAATACARHSVRTDFPVPTEWSLTVENHHWLDFEVSVVHGGQTTRVGLVTAATTQSFVLPAHLLGPGGDMQLVASAVGSLQRISTAVITIRGGQSVEWTIEQTLRNSSFSVH